MMTGERDIRSVCVLGGGVVGLSAALAFAAALPGLRVSVIESPLDPAAFADRAPIAWPAINRFHESIGLREAEVLAAGAADWRLGTRVVGWSADGQDWLSVHGQVGVPVGPAAFHEVWARARRAGAAQAFHRYAAGAVLAEAGRFVHPEPDPRSPLSTYDYALRPDPVRYRDLLADLARARGVVLVRDELAGVERRADGGVAVLALASGVRLEADLYLDCSGPASRLLSVLDPAIEDWSAHLPEVAVEEATDPRLPSGPCDVLTAGCGGWTWAAPLPDRTISMAARFVSGAGRAGDGARVRPGRRAAPWRRNVLALGDAAIQLDPLWGTGLLLAHRGIRRALELLPGRSCDPVELREYNRRTGQEALIARDFLALHYGRHPGLGAAGGAAAAGGPDSLAHLLDQFGRRGRLPVLEEDPFGKEAWIAALIGLGVVPRATSPLAEGADAGHSAELMQDLAAGFASLPAQLPEYSRYLARAGSGSGRSASSR